MKHIPESDPGRQRSSWEMLTERVRTTALARVARDEDVARSELVQLAREASLLAKGPLFPEQGIELRQSDWLRKTHSHHSS